MKTKTNEELQQIFEVLNRNMDTFMEFKNNNEDIMPRELLFFDSHKKEIIAYATTLIEHANSNELLALAYTKMQHMAIFLNQTLRELNNFKELSKPTEFDSRNAHATIRNLSTSFNNTAVVLGTIVVHLKLYDIASELIKG